MTLIGALLLVEKIKKRYERPDKKKAPVATLDWLKAHASKRR